VARLAGNYTAFVSDGAFNDLSISESLVLSTVCSFVRIRRSRAACPASGAKKFDATETQRADRIESNRIHDSNPLQSCRGSRRQSRRPRMWNCSRFLTRALTSELADSSERTESAKSSKENEIESIERTIRRGIHRARIQPYVEVVLA